MMPMGGAGAGGSGDQQRQRRGWLRETEDVWGVKDQQAAPPVLGSGPDPYRPKKDDDLEDF